VTGVVRTFKNLFAHLFGQVVTILGTILLPWICLSQWTADEFGAWVVISAIAQLYMVSDLGFSNALANHVFLDSSDRENYLNKFKAGVRVVGVRFFWSLFFIFLMCFFYDFYRCYVDGAHQYSLSISLFLISSAMAMQPVINLFSGVMRAKGENSKGILISNFIRLFELLSVALFVGLGGSVLFAAMILFLVRVSIVVFLLWKMLPTDWSGNLECSRDSLPVALNEVGFGFAANMAALNIALHGMVLVVSTGGAALAASFSAARTAARIPGQPIGIVFSSIAPELTALFSNGKFSEFRKIGVLMALGALVFAIFSGCVVLYFSDWLEMYWLHGKLTLNGPVLVFLVLSMIFHVLWQAGAQVLASINVTFKVGFSYLFLTLVGVFCAFVAHKYYQSLGVAIVWLSLEIVMLFVILNGIRFLMKKNFPE
jgi:O-antigen/teichoic acid export membrane protein